MTIPTELHVGMRLFLVPHDNRLKPCNVVVQKVARKWAYISGFYAKSRISIETLEVDGGDYFSPAQCYFSKEGWEQVKSRKEAWRKLRVDITNRADPPDLVLLESIQQARLLLGLFE